jgi:hypothetical protein
LALIETGTETAGSRETDSVHEPHNAAHRRRLTVVLAPDQGFSSRYLLRTDIYRTLRDSGAHVVILSPHAREPYFVQEFSADNVSLEHYDVEAGLTYLASSRLHRRLRLLRDMTAKGTADLATFEARRKREIARGRWRQRIIDRVMSVPIKLLRRSRLLRRSLVAFESRLFTPRLYEPLFRKYRPDLLVVTSVGNLRGPDALLMREARRHRCKVASVVLSWDNSTSRGIGGAAPDFVVAWTPTMKRELVEYQDLKSQQIFVGGVAHWDRYYSGEGRTRDELFRQLGLEPDRKLVLFATAAPTGWAELNIDVVHILGRAISERSLAGDCQILVRLHPNYFSGNRESIARDPLRQIEEAAAAYAHVHLTKPKLNSRGVTFDLSAEDASDLQDVLRHCEVVVTSFSTVMIEACIFDRPVVNVAFAEYSPRMGQPYVAVANYAHLKRILAAGGTRTATTPAELLEWLNHYLVQPGTDKDGRIRIREQESGPYPGTAGRRIGEHLMQLGRSASHQ